MFSVYPGFEDLSLRVEVEWRGCTRRVTARLEQWLDSRKAALVCVFEDDEEEGEWIIVDKGSGLPYTMARPDKLKIKQTSFDEATRVLSKTWKFQAQGIEKFLGILRRAFGGENFTVARLLELSELPAHRNLAICTAESCRWIFGFEHQNWAAFAEQSLFNSKYTQAQAQLRAQWQMAQSDTRFAWEWAALDDAQRKLRLGWPASWQAMERIMRLILMAMSAHWQACDDIFWDFIIDAETGALKSEFYDLSGDIVLHEPLLGWEECLLRQFAPHWRADLFRRYGCVSQYVNANCYYGGNVHLTSRPTAHQQLEARLALRDWLADAATPDVATRLLASLDE